MNVLNRKMFSNRDARKKLAGMGGILASSPELMGTAQRFQEGGQGNAEQEFIVNIPGFSAPGEMLRITESTLAQLTELVPELLSQKDTLVAPVELLADVKSRPGDAVVSTRLRRMFEAPAERTSVSENLTLDSQSMANRAAAASLLGQQLSGLTLMPERTPGELEVVVEGEDQRAAEAATRRRIADEDMAMARPVPRNDFRTFPVEMPSEGEAQPAAPVRTQTAADIANETALRNREMASENAGRLTAEELMSPDVKPEELMPPDVKPEDLAASRLAASAGFVGEDEPTITDYSTLSDPDLEKLLSLNPRNPDPTLLDEILSRSTPQPGMPFILSESTGVSRDGRTDAEILAEAQAAIERYDTNAGRDAEGNLLPVAPDYELTEAIEAAKAAEPQAEGIASFGMFDPLVDRFKEIRSEDAARNAAASAGDVSALLGVGSENDPAFLSSAIEYGREILPNLTPFVEKTQEAFSDPVAAFRSEMAARQGAGERNYANAVQRIEVLNQRIADAQAAGDEILAQQLTTARDQLAGTLLNEERKTDVVEGILAIPTAVNEAFQRSSLGVGLRGPDATARTLTELAAEQKAAVEAEATRERRLAELLGGATATSTAVVEADPAVEAPVVEAPVVEAPVVEAPVVEAPDAEAPVVEAPDAEAPDAEAPKTNVIPPGVAKVIAQQVNNNPNNANKVVSGAILDGAGVDTTGMDLKERTVAMRKVLSDIMGDTPEDEKNEFWMNMAMMGFAVAAGESPDALKNIADGMLASTAQIQQGKAAKKERQDKMTLTAFGEVLADQRATDKFGRDTVLASIRAAGGTGTQEPYVDAVRVLAQKGLDSNLYTTMEEALTAAAEALAPYYDGTASNGGNKVEYIKGNSYQFPGGKYTYLGGDIKDINNFELIKE
jgi:hypothetical protein